MPCQQSRRYQGADCDGGATRTVLQTGRRHTIGTVFVSLIKNAFQKGRPARTALVLPSSMELLNGGAATRSFAIFSSGIFDSCERQAGRPALRNYNNRLIFTNQM